MFLLMRKINLLLVQVGMAKSLYKRKIQSNKSLYRNLKEANFGKPISIMTLCVETDTLVTVSDDEVFIWTYDSMKLLGTFNNKSSEIMAIELILTMPFLATLDKTSQIFIWSLKIENRSSFLKPIVKIEMGIPLADQLSKDSYSIFLVIRSISRYSLLEQSPAAPPKKFWFSKNKTRDGK